MTASDKVSSGGNEGLPRDPEDLIEERLAALREAWYSGKNPDPDSFCREHPECGPKLRRKIDDFIHVAGGFKGASRGHEAR
jgi:hypothetical protein